MKASQVSKESRGPLTIKQENFVSEYVKSGNATEAAVKAGYSEKTAGAIGHENLKKPEIARAIEEHRNEVSKRLQLEEDFELKKAMRLLEMCMEPEHVYSMAGEKVVDEQGNYVMRFDSKGANMALQTIAKLRGKFVNKVEVGFADNLAAQLEAIVE